MGADALHRIQKEEAWEIEWDETENELSFGCLDSEASMETDTARRQLMR